MSQVILNVPDISCAHCEATVLSTLQGKPGVRSVQVSVPDKKVYLDYDESAANLDEMSAALDEEGYPVESSQEGTPPEAVKRNFIPLVGK